MQVVQFVNWIELILGFFPGPLSGGIFIALEVHKNMDNIFFELEVAYKKWDLQGVGTRLKLQVPLPVVSAGNL